MLNPKTGLKGHLVRDLQLISSPQGYFFIPDPIFISPGGPGPLKPAKNPNIDKKNLIYYTSILESRSKMTSSEIYFQGRSTFIIRIIRIISTVICISKSILFSSSLSTVSFIRICNCTCNCTCICTCICTCNMNDRAG